MVKEHFIGLIDKYLSGSATEAEKRLVEEYVKKLETGSSTSFDELGAQNLKEEMWQQIQLQTRQQTATLIQMPWYRRKIVRSIAVAAAVILVIGLGILFFTSNQPDEQPIAQNDNQRTNGALVLTRREVNTTGKEKRIQLPDGSLIILANNSEVTYRQPFGDTRDITLIGKGYFKVAKDKAKPFIVVSKDISTTALGTEFTVTAFPNINRIVIRLYEGKVVVKAVDKMNKRMKNDVYLLPGQEFVYGNQTTAAVKTFALTKEIAPEQIMKEERVYDNPLLPKDADDPWFMFNNQPLEKVLTDLAALYNVEIVYDEKDVRNIFFTSKYNRTTSLEAILKQICTPNHLVVTKKDSAFIISR